MDELLMENSVVKSGGAEISRKNRSLDLKSLYKSTVLKKEGNNKRRSGVADNGEVRKKKRKTRKEVSLSSLEPGGKKSRNSIEEVGSAHDGASSDLLDSQESESGLSRGLDRSSGFNNISLNLDANGNVIRIPKRRRGLVGRKKFVSNQGSSTVGGSVDQIAKSNGECEKFEGNQVSNRLGPPCADDANSGDDQIAKLDNDSAGKVVSPKVKGAGFDDLKENRASRANSARHAKEKDGHLIVNNGDASSRKHRSNRRKRKKELTSGSESLAKKVEPLADICDGFQDEDEDNLEQNAARMLSSRFDPSCTGFHTKIRSSASPSRNESSFFVSSGQDFVSQGVNSAGFESASGDTASRVLRPRKEHKEKGMSRKRRHFYEILSSDLDEYWVLNRKIKVFWPLDESWYYGLVNDYDPERKLHHIKYDDRDEEWINLRNERFKLLLLPSEVPHKLEAKGATERNEHDDSGKRDLTSDDDSFMGSYMESEPIITWLARSSRRVKSSPLGVSKRHKASHLSPKFGPLLLSSSIDDAHGCLDMGSSERDMDKSSSNSALPEVFTNTIRGENEKFVLEDPSSSKDRRSPVVYFRRRFRKKAEGLSSGPKDNNACGSPVSGTSLASVVHGLHASEFCDISLGPMDTEGLLWSVDNSGLIKLNMSLVESKQLRFELGSPIPVLGYIFGAENSWVLRNVLLLHYGTLMTTWPKVHLEMLFVDNIVGLRFLSFEGCLKQAVAFVFLVLAVFYRPTEQGKYVDMQMPVTSIRFKFSWIEDLRKQHMFAFYSFSKLKYSKWLYLDCKLQQHCLLSKKLPLSDCTYDNIKALEGGFSQLHTNSSDRKPAACEGIKMKSARCIMPIGAFRDSSVAMNHSSSSKSNANHGKFLPFALSFAAAPTFFLSLHLKLLMENSVACVSLRDHDLMYSLEHSENTGHPIADSFTLIQDCSESVSEITPNVNPVTSFREAESSGWLHCAKSQLETDATLDGGLVKPSHNFQNGILNVAGTSACSTDPGGSSLIVQSQKLRHSSLESEKFSRTPQPLVPNGHVPVGMSDSMCYSSVTALSVEIPSLDQVERPADGPADAKTPSDTQSADLAWNLTYGILCSPKPTGPRSIWHYNRNGESSSFGASSHLWPNGIRNGFGNGPKKPRTQVQYTLPSGGFDFSSKHKIHNQRGFPYKRIRKANEKRMSVGSRNSHRNLELLACDANVLITIGDRGWRECGARVVLELADHNEWRLAVKISGTLKYSYKAHQFLQPGSTNRYTHAMMWKGGKDWVLEFPDRSQWMLFKEMHAECHNRNIRAASVKNIPIPGVRLMEESDDNGSEVPFIRSSPKYFRQVETDVDMAMDPSRIVYDMDSDDEHWISENQKSSCASGSKCEEISEELFEKAMDLFEKVAYSQQCDHFTSDEIEKFIIGVGPIEAIKLIHEHWQLKRQRKGMPLIRHLQPPLWERYEQQVKEWEQAMAKVNTSLSNGCQAKAPTLEKPPMFAFCLKPRGLEVPNKGSKQRSHRKFSIYGHSHASLGDQDGLHAFGRRSNGFAFGDESLDVSPTFQTSRVFSPRDASGSACYSLNGDWSEWNHHPKLHRNKSKKIGTILSPSSPQTVALYNQRTIGKRNGVHRWNMGLPEWPSQKHYPSEGYLRHGIEQLDGSELDEFRLRDASGAAQHALNMAKLKRERAQRLLYRADLAIHKAVVALMTADAIKASSEDLNAANDDGSDDETT